MTLGRGLHGLDTRIDNPYRSAGLHARKSNEGLDGKIELGAESAADRRRDDADILASDVEDPGQAFPVQDRRLGAGVDRHPAFAPDRVTSFGLDVGMFDKSGSERGL